MTYPRVITREPWELEFNGGSLRLPEPPPDSLSSRLPPLTALLIEEFVEHELQVVPSNSLAGGVSALDQTDELIGIPPGLKDVVSRCVHEIFLLRSPDDSIDISHSDPCWPTRIFISIPTSTVADLRVAEAVVHEAMHLNLTFFEHCTALVSEDATLYSPWKDEARPVLGVLHGLYVFACVYRFFSYLAQLHDLDPWKHRHINQRAGEIRTEAESLDRPLLLKSLTNTGSSLAQSCFTLIGSSSREGAFL